MASSPLGTVGVTPRWIEAQKATPSFLVAASAADSATALDMPLPAALMSPQESKGMAPTDHKGARTPRQALGGTANTPTRFRARTPPGGVTPGHPYGSTSPIYEELIQRGKMYEMRREALQERSIARELKQCRDVPKISEMGHNIERAGHIVDRLYKLEAQKRKMHTFKIMEIEKKEGEMFQNWFEPKISRRGSRSVGKTMKNRELWAFRRQERLEENRRQFIIKEMQHVQEAPEINLRSEQLAAKRRERDGMAGYSHIDAMIERDRLSKLSRWEQSQRQFADEHPGTPRITAMAANLAVEGDVVDRLFQREQLRQHRLAEKERFERERLQALHSPSITAASHIIRRQQEQQAVHDYGQEETILDRNMRRVAEKEARLEHIREEERQRHRPTIDPLSAAIAEQLPTTPMERLSQIRSTALKGSPVPLDTPDAGGLSATPGYRLRAAGGSTSMSPPPSMTTASPIPSGSRVGSPTPNVRGRATAATAGVATGASTANDSKAAHPDTAAWLQRMEAAEARRKQRLEAAAREAEERELAECTFAPATATSRYDEMGGAPPWLQGALHARDATDPFTRQQEWLEKKNDRIEQRRQQLEQQELQDCTFQPTTYQGQAAGGDEDLPASTLYGGDGRAWGFAGHVNRLHDARDRQQPFDAAPAEAPSRRMTVPQEFKLGAERSRTPPGAVRQQQQRPTVPALSRPVGPPVFHDEFSGQLAGVHLKAGAAARGVADAFFDGQQRRPAVATPQGAGPAASAAGGGSRQSKQPASSYDNIEYLDDQDEDLL